MLGIFGFTTAAIVFVIYALSFNKIHFKKSSIQIEYYQFAYAMLAVSCIFWAMGILIDDEDGLIRSIILGNISLLLGTIAIAHSVIKKKYKNVATIVLAVLSLVFVIARVQLQPPEPYVDEGILVFNSSAEVGALLGIVFLFIWMPCSLYVTRALTDKKYFRPLRTISEFSVVLASMGVLSFLAADTSSMIVLSFGVICCSFGPLIGLNYLVRRGVK